MLMRVGEPLDLPEDGVETYDEACSMGPPFVATAILVKEETRMGNKIRVLKEKVKKELLKFRKDWKFLTKISHVKLNGEFVFWSVSAEPKEGKKKQVRSPRKAKAVKAKTVRKLTAKQVAQQEKDLRKSAKMKREQGKELFRKMAPKGKTPVEREERRLESLGLTPVTKRGGKPVPISEYIKNRKKYTVVPVRQSRGAEEIKVPMKDRFQIKNRVKKSWRVGKTTGGVPDKVIGGNGAGGIFSNRWIGFMDITSPEHRTASIEISSQGCVQFEQQIYNSGSIQGVARLWRYFEDRDYFVKANLYSCIPLLVPNGRKKKTVIVPLYKYLRKKHNADISVLKQYTEPKGLRKALLGYFNEEENEVWSPRKQTGKLKGQALLDAVSALKSKWGVA